MPLPSATTTRTPRQRSACPIAQKRSASVSGSKNKHRFKTLPPSSGVARLAPNI
jgi:hypothetical protein